MDTQTRNEIEKIIQDCISLSDEIQEWIITYKSLRDFFDSSIQQVYTLLLPDESFEYRKFDSWKKQKYLWQWRVIPGYATSDNQIKDLKQILEDITGYKKPDSEIHIMAKDEFTARRYFTKLFEWAKSDIFIIDNYLSSVVFDFLEEIDDTVILRFLWWEQQIKSWFKNSFLVWNRKNIECRLHNSTNHDRYIILDNNEIYHIWGSLNWIGKNDFTVSKLEWGDKIKDLERLWNESEILKK